MVTPEREERQALLAGLPAEALAIPKIPFSVIVAFN
jgi:hypothetical protein